jgi:signal peptidase I
MRLFGKELVVVVVLAIVVFLLLRLVVAGHSVENDSMAPSLNAGERILINKLAFAYTDPERGDIVFYEAREAAGEKLGRVIGLSGDIIEVKDRVVHINKIPLKEPYVRNLPRFAVAAYQVPAGSYFIMEDNRSGTGDSSAGKAVPRENIRGRAWACAWPPDKWGGVESYSLDPQLASAGSP